MREGEVVRTELLFEKKKSSRREVVVREQNVAVREEELVFLEEEVVVREEEVVREEVV